MMPRTFTCNASFPTAASRRFRPRGRRGVASVLAMMFLVIFGSLCAVMAVVAQGNLRTADSYLKVSRATGAAETGLVFAQRRLAHASRRFIVTKGVVDDDFGTKLWLGTYGLGDGTVEVLPTTDFTEGVLPSGLAQAIRNAHLADEHTVEIEPADALLPDIDEFGTLRTRPIVLYETEGSAYFRLRYEVLADGRFIRVTSQGIDGDIQRTLQMDFRINKKIEFAVISPNRVMIGKNVLIEGPLGTRYGIVSDELDPPNGHPLVMRSDFRHLHPGLTADIDLLVERIAEFDVDGDGRLRPNHPVEAQGLNGLNFEDRDGDQYIDDFDLFLMHFDTNNDGMIVYDADLANAAGLGILAVEFNADLQLARLIDTANADRNGDGVVDQRDIALGYNDGVLDGRDMYAKVRGRLAFAVDASSWEASKEGNAWQTFVNGPIRHGVDESPVTFEVSEDDLLDITTADFLGGSNWLKTTALAGQSFSAQVAGQIGSGSPPAAYTAPNDNEWETVPYGAKGYYDWYRRAIYENMTFENVVIPAGNNGLFINCTFIGSTYIQVHAANGDTNWNYVGMVDRHPVHGTFDPKFPGLAVDIDGNAVTDTRLYSNNIRFHGCTFAGSIVSDTPEQYAHVRNKVQFTGSTTFTLEHPSLTAAMIEELSKTSIMMPGYSVDVGNFTNNPDEKVELKGTIIAGILDARGTVDIHGTLLMTFRPVVQEGPLYYGGTPDGFNTTIGYFGPSDGDAESVDPSTLVDNRNPGYPDTPGVPEYDGIPDLNVDLDGDGIMDPFTGFGQITLRYDPDAKLPDGIPWPIRIEAVKGTYTEGGSM